MSILTYRNQLRKRFSYFFYIFFKTFSCYHELVLTAKAFYPEIRPGTQDFPLFTAAGMLFFQFDYISYLNIHLYLLPPFFKQDIKIDLTVYTVHRSVHGILPHGYFVGEIQGIVVICIPLGIGFKSFSLHDPHKIFDS